MYKSDDAVSPVIGVILMVAITVILAAVIAAFVFGMAGNVDKTKVVSVVGERVNSSCLASTPGASGTNGWIKITNYGGQDASKLVNGTTAFTVKVNGETPTAPTTSTLTDAVGTIGYYQVPGTQKGAGQDDVSVTALFQDGKSAVIYSSKL